jgi:hypothetical protein
MKDQSQIKALIKPKSKPSCWQVSSIWFEAIFTKHHEPIWARHKISWTRSTKLHTQFLQDQFFFTFLKWNCQYLIFIRLHNSIWEAIKQIKTELGKPLNRKLRIDNSYRLIRRWTLPVVLIVVNWITCLLLPWITHQKIWSKACRIWQSIESIWTKI